MGLGGGTWSVQNKVLPGSYINFVSAARASATLSNRGLIAMPLELNWGPEGEVFTVELGEFQKDSFKLFGYAYTAPEVQSLREMFKGAKKAYLYRINSGGNKATITIGELTATAKYSGIRGNDIIIIIENCIDDEEKFDVITRVNMQIVDTQRVATVEELANNDFVIFSGTGGLDTTAGANLAGGDNATVNGEAYSDFLDKIEAFGFNVLGYPGTDALIKDLFAQFTKRMRENHGVKFQTVLHQYNGIDYEGIISVENEVLNEGLNKAGLVYWVAGKQAGCLINKSLTNSTYDGEFDIQVDYKQSELESGIKEGKFMFHQVGESVNVLDDINTLISFTTDKNEDFSNNQVIRTLDQIGNDIAVLFNTRYLGKVQNNKAGRIAFWSDLVFYHEQLQQISAIENFEADDIKVEEGNDKKSILVTEYVTPVSVMTKLYMTVYVD